MSVGLLLVANAASLPMVQMLQKCKRNIYRFPKAAAKGNSFPHLETYMAFASIFVFFLLLLLFLFVSFVAFLAT